MKEEVRTNYDRGKGRRGNGVSLPSRVGIGQWCGLFDGS